MPFQTNRRLDVEIRFLVAGIDNRNLTLMDSPKLRS
jgi:hypothetical protein